MRRIIKKIGFVLLSLPKTLYFNLKTFGIKGITMPVLISYKTTIRTTYRGAIKIDAPKKMFMMTFGYGGSDGVIANNKSELCLEQGSQMTIGGKVQFAEGCAIRNSGEIFIGNNSGMNKNSFLSCYNSISIGNNFTAGWNVNIRDSDGHTVIKDGKKKDFYAPVIIGDDVWVCAFADLLKGVKIANNTVVAYRSLVLGTFEEGHVLIGGMPAKVIQRNIDWED